MNIPGAQFNSLPKSLEGMLAQFRRTTPQTMPMPTSDPGIPDLGASAIPPPPAPALLPPAGPKAGSNFGRMMQKALPALLALVARKQGGPEAGAGLLEGYARGEMQRRQAEQDALELELQTIENAEARAARRAEFDRRRLMERESWVRALQEDLDKVNDPEQYAAYIDRAARYGAPLHGLSADDVKQMFTFPDSRVGIAAREAARKRIAELKRVHSNFDELLRVNAVDKASGKPLQDIMATAELLVTDDKGAPILPPANDDVRIPNSDTGFNLQIDIEAEEERLGRKLRPGERQKVRDRFLANRAALQRAARRGSGSGAKPAPKNPRGENAIPQGVERYILDMRTRGYTQNEALSEMLSAQVWTNMQRDHPSMTAERARKAITELIPEEGAAVPMSAPSGARGRGQGQSGTGAEVPADRVITRAELTAAAQRLGIPESEARAEYEARGFVIR